MLTKLNSAVRNAAQKPGQALASITGSNPQGNTMQPPYNPQMPMQGQQPMQPHMHPMQPPMQPMHMQGQQPMQGGYPPQQQMQPQQNYGQPQRTPPGGMAASGSGAGVFIIDDGGDGVLDDSDQVMVNNTTIYVIVVPMASRGHDVQYGALNIENGNVSLASDHEDPTIFMKAENVARSLTHLLMNRQAIFTQQFCQLHGIAPDPIPVPVELEYGYKLKLNAANPMAAGGMNGGMPQMQPQMQGGYPPQQQLQPPMQAGGYAPQGQSGYPPQQPMHQQMMPNGVPNRNY